ncbi:Group 2 truncated hemoglobin YjbI [Sinobacterium norvegicum]|uniref:Group 2 truncated hemoglobin YjbI n=1 Tax=Sinobacterium norvegicum TaxID=1641715 RepID=A0ABN8ESM2_9GAMM|nr:group II truncated hemoglobin [Sinobacterium norvegicum]CAH0993356.1 Group 2 truncated hemoglobin YjbI [Sinobacterium norvegicum]
MSTPYQLLGQEDGIRALANAFYEAMDELEEAQPIRRMHADNLDAIKNSLFMYLTGWLGGPPLYADATSSVCLTTPHKGFSIGEKERDQWLLCMDAALEKINASDEVKAMLKEPMWQLADFIRNNDKG